MPLYLQQPHAPLIQQECQQILHHGPKARPTRMPSHLSRSTHNPAGANCDQSISTQAGCHIQGAGTEVVVEGTAQQGVEGWRIGLDLPWHVGFIGQLEVGRTT